MIVFPRVLILMVLLHSIKANLFNNSKMEEAFGDDNWYCRGCDVENSTDKYEGTYSANVTSRTTNWHGLTHSVSMTGNTRYKALVMVKLSNLNSTTDLFNTVELLYRCEDDNGNKEVVKFGKVKFTHENRWTKIGGVITTAAVVKKCIVYVQVYGANVNYLVDDTELVSIPDDPNWKTEANKRIKKLRKNDILIMPSNVGSNTYEIELTQTKHGFPFGTAVHATEMLDSATDYKHYQDKVYELFDWVVIENKLKWNHMEYVQGTIKYEDAINALKNMTSRGLKVRGHCVFWATEDKVQDWVKALNKSALATAITARIEDVVPRCKGLVKHWDVNNENIHGDYFEQRLGNKDITSQMFRDVNALDKDVQLFLNDYNVIKKWDTLAMLDEALRVKANNVSLYGIGIQSHVTVADIDPVTMKERLDILNEAKLPIWITEMSVTEKNATIKASSIVDLMTLYFSYPRIKGILLWGFWDGFISDPDNALWEGGNATTPMVPNEAGVAFENLIKNTWMTKKNLTFTTNDTQTVNAFKGSYKLQVKQDGVVNVTKSFRLGNANRNVTIDFSATPIAITVN